MTVKCCKSDIGRADAFARASARNVKIDQTLSDRYMRRF
jgi:hypothetical protein